LRSNRRIVTSGFLAIVLAVVVTVAEATDASVATEAGCLERAAAWAEVHPTLLRAIAWVESRGDHRALNWNRNGSYDVGLMQINSWWYERGLGPWWHALGQPCVNVAAGAWVLKQCVDEYGYAWNAVGCYNVGSAWTKGPRRLAGEAYIRKVQQALGIRPGAAANRSTTSQLTQKHAVDRLTALSNDWPARH
jgi:soluble lytic murein transglycosylase-like protein